MNTPVLLGFISMPKSTIRIPNQKKPLPTSAFHGTDKSTSLSLLIRPESLFIKICE
jgi:hypothetical protein